VAQDERNIHIGGGRIWLGVTAPASGVPPTLMGHTSGVPATGTEVGHTEGNATFTYRATKELIPSEQALGAVGAFVTDELVSLAFRAQERVYQALRAAFDAIGTVTDASKDLFFGGGQTISPLTQAIMLTSPRRDVAAKWEVLVIYKAVNMEGVEIAYGKANRSTYQITLRGLADTSRVIGDQLFQWYREK
jgi:hypothetical protein